MAQLTDRSDTQIVATIGPSSGAREKMSRMIEAGMDIARLNCTWGDPAQHESFIEPLREEAKKLGRRVPWILDLPGPRVEDGAHHHVGTGPVITDEDIEHVRFGIAHHVEYFAQSFVSRAEDVTRLRDIVRAEGGAARIIAKIERAEALRDIQAILRVSDAIMVARGDLGNEIPLETIPFVEADLIKAARAAKRPVIVATEMLSSMIDTEHLSRADVTDIAYAVMHGADCVMLSDETARGRFPIESVEMMEKTLLEAEKHITIRRNAL